MPRRLKKVTTIQVSKEVRDLLKEMGKKGETYDDILRRVLRRVKKWRCVDET